MKLRALECLCEIVAAGFNLSIAAHHLAASQPTITRQIQRLEADLGFEVLRRSGKRVIGLTAQGAVVHEHALRMLQEAEVLKNLPGSDAASSGRIAIATTHFHAKYTLLEPLVKLRERHPKVTVALVAGDSGSIPDMVSTGEADMGISVEAIEPRPELAFFPCTEIRRVLLMPKGHRLSKLARVTAEQMARYPVIVYGQRFGANRRVLQIFADRGLTPDIALTTADVEVIKGYVAAGVGISIVPSRAYDRRRDSEVTAVPIDHLIAPVTAMLSLRRGMVLRPYTRELMKLLAPCITENDLASTFS
jgi:LysR family transcriptional regulator, cys regulon transcriptional activator